MADPAAFSHYVGYDALNDPVPTTLSDEQHGGVYLFTSQDSFQDTVIQSMYYDNPSSDPAPNPWQPSSQHQHDSRYNPPLFEQTTFDRQHHINTPPSFPHDISPSQAFVQGSRPPTSLPRIDPWSPGCASDNTAGVGVAQLSGTGAFDVCYSDATWADTDTILPDEDCHGYYYTGTGGALGGIAPVVPGVGGWTQVVGYDDCENDGEDKRGGSIDASYEAFISDSGSGDELFYSPRSLSSSFPWAASDIQTPSTPIPVQHVPVAPQYRSSYSELSANVAFISTMTQETRATASEPTSQPSSSILQVDVQTVPLIQAQANHDDSADYQSKRRSIRRSHPSDRFISTSSTTQIIPPPPVDSSSPSLHPHRTRPPAHGRSTQNNTLHDMPPTTSSSSRTASPSSSTPPPGSGPVISSTSDLRLRTIPPISRASARESRRAPNLACFFCREHKIACGRPAIGSADPTCNQCRRRAHPCDYPKESLRGQYRRAGTGKNGGGGGGGDGGGDGDVGAGVGVGDNE